MAQYRIISTIENKSKIEKFIIQIKINFLFFYSWKDKYSYYEKYENGNLERVEFSSYADAEAYLFLKNKSCYTIIKNQNTYDFIDFMYNSY